ncbi:MAG: hypothetical protein AB7E55_33700 [Pigmentiphaga sp.]
MLPLNRQDPAFNVLPEVDERAAPAASAFGSLIQQLPNLASHTTGIDFPGSDPQALVAVAGAAEALARNAHTGLQSLGILLSSLRDEGMQQQAASALPGLGILVAELSALASQCSELAADCRRETLDYDPGPQAGISSHE